MSWTAPVTRATGYIVLATDWNAIENNLLVVDRVYAKKTTAKTVNTTTTATDLLNGEVTIAAGDMGTDGLVRVTAWGDWKQNTGADRAIPAFQLKLGGTTLIATSSPGVAVAASTSARFGWKIVCEIQNLGAANSQQSYFDGKLEVLANGTDPWVVFSTGNGGVHGTPASTLNFAAIYAGGNTTAVDTTASCALVLNVVNQFSSANYETKLLGALVELL